MLDKKIILVLATLLVITLPSCHSGHHHSEENHESHTHDSHEHHGTFSTTTYSKEYEVFSEMSPFIAGEEASIMAHITQTATYTPVPAHTTVTLQLADGKKVVVNHTLSQATRLGIYRFTFAIPSQIEGDNLQPIVTVHSGDQEVAIRLQTQPFFTADAPAHAYIESHTIHAVNAVSFTKEQSWKIPFHTDIIHPQPFKSVIKTVAQVQSSQSNEQTVTMPIAGTVSFNHKILTNGMYVRKGQVLMYVEPQGIGSENMAVVYAQKKADYIEAKANFTRKKQLLQEGIVSEADYLQAQTTLKKIKLEFESMQSMHVQSKQKIVAPLSGYIKNLTIDNGQFIHRGLPLMSIAQNQYVYLEAQVAPRYFHQLQSFSTATFIDPQSHKSIALEDVGGELISYDHSLRDDRTLLSAIFKIKNIYDWIPGRLIDMYIQTGDEASLKLYVPNTAIVESMNQYFLYVQINPETFEQRLVTLGETNGQSTTILKGLEANERVVTEGAALIKISQSTGQLDPHAGHSH